MYENFEGNEGYQDTQKAKLKESKGLGVQAEAGLHSQPVTN